VEVLGKCPGPQNRVCGMQWAPKMGQRPKISKSVVLWPLTPCMLVVVFYVYFWRENEESGMSFRRDDCTGTDASSSVLWSGEVIEVYIHSFFNLGTR
jgi:hypothetical protein